MRQANVYMYDHLAGKLIETEDGYEFTYLPEYLALPAAMAVSLTLPLQEKPHKERYLFPFFDGLIPEGWLLDIAANNWKLSPRDRMGLLMQCCHDCIGAVSIKAEEVASE